MHSQNLPIPYLNFFWKHILTFLFLWGSVTTVFSQKKNNTRIFLVEPEFMIGKVIPIYDNFPQTDYRKSLFLNIGILNTDPKNNWVSFYNYPTVGISFSASHLGNSAILKNEFSLIPYIILKTSRNQRKSVDFKLGLGASYFNNPYNADKNPDNLVIGSRFSWAFQLFMYKNLLVTDIVNIKMGFGFLHSSNSHTTLPNYGLNSVMVSLAAQFAINRYDPDFALKQEKKPIDKTKHYFLQTRVGLGWHELGGTWAPIGGPDYPVHTFSLSTGILFKQQLKLKLGFNYRFYQSFYDFILKTQFPGFGENPKSEASNVNIFVGAEFLIGHVGMDVEVGFNIYKPFYEQINYRWEFNEGFKYFRNKYIATRLGLKYYIINTNRLPRHNVFLGSHINANFGKADFMDISMGYIYMIK